MANSCLNCQDCTETTPAIPNCGDATYLFGYAPLPNFPYILEFVKPSGAILQVQITSGPANEVEIDRSALPTGYNSEFFTAQASPFEVRLRGIDNVIVNLNDQALLPAARDTACILVNYQGIVENTFIALPVPLTYSI